jgi:hypothetical protein
MEEKNIYSLLNEVQAELRVPKGQWNDFGGFHYRSAEDILEAVKPLLYKRDMTLIMTDDAVMMGERHYIKATVTIYHGDQHISVSAYAREAESRPKMDVAQLTGSASSYARKYALNGLLLIDDIKDADTNEYNKQGNGKPKAKAKPVDDDRLPWDMDEDEGEYLAKDEVATLQRYAIRKLGRDEAEVCLRKMYAYYKVASETLLKTDTSLYYGYIDKWGESNVNTGN